jgi:hypothetical protein
VFPDSVWCVDHQDLRIYEQVSREIETKWLRSEQTIRDLQAQLTSLKELTESKEAQLKGKVNPTFPREIARAYFLVLARFAISRSRECPGKDLCLCLRTMIVLMSAVGSRLGAFAPADTKRPTRR